MVVFKGVVKQVSHNAEEKEKKRARRPARKEKDHPERRVALSSRAATLEIVAPFNPDLAQTVCFRR